LNQINKKKIIIHKERCTGCRICQLWCSYIHNQKFIPSKAYIKVQNEYDLNVEISFSEDCSQCGQCANYCLYNALEIKEAEN